MGDFRKKYIIKREDYSVMLDEAFLAEYGYKFSQLCKVIMNMIDYGNEREHDEIFVENKTSLIKYLLIDTGLTSEIVNKVISGISLNEWKIFLILLSEFRKEDVYSWRFNRAYSFNRSP